MWISVPEITSNHEGFTLIELLIATAISTVLLGALVKTFTTQRETYDLQEHIAAMMQQARVGIEMISRDVRMAGYNPSGAVFDGMAYDTTQLQMQADLNGDGDTADTDETIIYAYDSANLRLIRKVNGGEHDLTEHTTSFSFQYLEADGNATTTSANIRQVRVQIITRTPEPDPTYALNGGYRTYTLTSLITLRN